MIIHSVYFKLKDKSPEVYQAFLEDTKNFGQNIPGIDFLKVGTVIPEVEGEIYDKDFDVALVSIFPDQDALNRYLGHADHLDYCERNGGNWESIRVFDAQG